MDVEITIRYSDERPCTVAIARPDSGDLLYRIVTPVSGILQIVAQALGEARRSYEIEPRAGSEPQLRRGCNKSNPTARRAALLPSADFSIQKPPKG
jgi:hypothetical protein